jgi:hypothetical protein
MKPNEAAFGRPFPSFVADDLPFNEGFVVVWRQKLTGAEPVPASMGCVIVTILGRRVFIS